MAFLDASPLSLRAENDDLERLCFQRQGQMMSRYDLHKNRDLSNAKKY